MIRKVDVANVRLHRNAAIEKDIRLRSLVRGHSGDFPMQVSFDYYYSISFTVDDCCLYGAAYALSRVWGVLPHVTFPIATEHNPDAPRPLIEDEVESSYTSLYDAKYWCKVQPELRPYGRNYNVTVQPLKDCAEGLCYITPTKRRKIAFYKNVTAHTHEFHVQLDGSINCAELLINHLERHDFSYEGVYEKLYIEPC